MKTEDLIDSLARAPAAAPISDRAIMLTLAAAVAVPVAVFLAVAGVRADAPLAWVQPWAACKSALALVTFLLVLPQVPRLTRPEGAAELRLAWVWPLALGLLALWVAGYVTRPPQDRFAEMTLLEVGECLGFITLIAIAPTVVVLWLLRRGAVTDPLRAGAVGGLAAASGSAAGYSLFCTQDNPVFFVLWYGLAISAVSLVAALAGRRLLRW
jgi:hypothetical protein